MAERLGEMCFADSDRPVQDHRFVRFDEGQRGEVTDLRGGDLGVVGEVEVLDGGGLFEAGLTDPAEQRRCVAAGDLVFAEHLEELEMSELAGARLVEPGFEGVEHP